ncbi:MAG: hypothetical protein IJY47_03405 [Clostridia bacterium]|nr:hypothetical protein [Clostridia bacterium]
MKTGIKIALSITLSLMCCFMLVGYAQVTTDVSIQGYASATPPKEIFITGVTQGAVGELDQETLLFSDTILTSKVTLEEGTDGVMKAVYQIEVWNNTSVPYYYLAMVRGTYTDESGEIVAYSNPNIQMEADIQLGEEIAPDEKRIITVTATFAEGADTSDLTLTSTIEYQFGLEQPESSDVAAVSGVLARFPEILNTPEDYQQLTDALDANTLHPDYIGNVVGFLGLNNDVETVENLFGVALELNIDGENKPVTVVIQRSNVDGDETTGDSYSYQSGWFNPTTTTVNGNEMILFMTADDLTAVSGGSYVEVYAVVYTKDANGSEWYQVGDMYHGSAQAIGYLLGSTYAHDSFDPDTWRQLDENGNRTNITLNSIIQSLPEE